VRIYGTFNIKSEKVKEKNKKKKIFFLQKIKTIVYEIETIHLKENDFAL